MRVLQEEIPAGLFFLCVPAMGGMGVMRQMWVMGHDVSYGRTWDRLGEVVP